SSLRPDRPGRPGSRRSPRFPRGPRDAARCRTVLSPTARCRAAGRGLLGATVRPGGGRASRSSRASSTRHTRPDPGAAGHPGTGPPPPPGARRPPKAGRPPPPATPPADLEPALDYLLELQPGGRFRSWELRRPFYSVGREATKILLKDPHVSRRHLAVVRVGP